MSIWPSVFFCFGMITWVNLGGFSPNLVCALILWISGLGLLMGKFHQCLTELSAHVMSGFSFPDGNLISVDFHQTWCVHWYCKVLLLECKWVNFINFWQSYLSTTLHYFLFPDNNLSKYQWIFTKFGICIAILETLFRIANGQTFFFFIFSRVTCLQQVHIFVSGQ